MSQKLDYEIGLLGSILQHGIDEFRQSVKAPEALSEDFYKVLEGFEEHLDKHGKLPSSWPCKKVYGYEPPDDFGDEHPSFWTDLIEKDYFQDQLKQMCQSILEHARSDPYGAITSGSTSINDLAYKLTTVNNATESAVDYDEHVDYLRSLITNKPILTFHPELDYRLSGGFRRGELVTVAARPGEGKTWVLAINAIRAWKDGKRVLVVTTEMSAAEIRLRILCLALGLPIDLIANRILTPHRMAFEAAKQKWIEAGIYENMQIISKDESKIEDLESEIRVFNPDLVLVDGFYLLNTRHKERDKYVRIGYVINRLKRFARSQDVVVMVATQLNREGKITAPANKKQTKAQARDLSALGFSDEIGMISDHVIFLSRDQYEEHARLMRFEIPKGRRLSNSSDFFIEFDLHNPKGSFAPVDLKEYKRRIDIAKSEVEKQESQDSPGDMSATYNQADGFKNRKYFRNQQHGKMQSVLDVREQ